MTVVRCREVGYDSARRRVYRGRTNVGQPPDARQTVPVDRAVPGRRRRIEVGHRYPVPGVPGGDVHVGRRRVRHNDHPGVRSARTGHAGPDHRLVDHVPVRPVQVVLPGHVRGQATCVTRPIGHRAGPGRSRSRALCAPLRGQSRAAHRTDQPRVRTDRNLDHRFPISGRHLLVSKRVKRISIKKKKHRYFYNESRI